MQAQHYKRDMVIIDGVYINDFVDTPKGMFCTWEERLFQGSSFDNNNMIFVGAKSKMKKLMDLPYWCQ